MAPRPVTTTRRIAFCICIERGGSGNVTLTLRFGIGEVASTGQISTRIEPRKVSGRLDTVVDPFWIVILSN